MTDDITPHGEPPDEPPDLPGDAIEGWLSVPVFSHAEGEELEEMATYGPAPLRWAARAAQAVSARRHPEADPSPKPPPAGRERVPRRVAVGVAVATVVVAAAALFAPGGITSLTARPADARSAAPNPTTKGAAPGATTAPSSTNPPATAVGAVPTSLVTLPPLSASGGAAPTTAPAPTTTVARPRPATTTAPPAGASTTPAAPSLAATPVVVARPDARLKDPLPVGKYWWVAAGTAPSAALRLVSAAAAGHVRFLAVSAGSSAGGTPGERLLKTLIPLVHRAGLRVVAVDQPTLADPAADAARGVRLAAFTVQGQHPDGLMLVLPPNATGTTVAGYAAALRAGVGLAYPLLAAVQPPAGNGDSGGSGPIGALSGLGRGITAAAGGAKGSSAPPATVGGGRTGAVRVWGFDAAQLADFDALAPLVAVGPRGPTAAARSALAALSALGQPLLPVATGAPAAGIARFVGLADHIGGIGVGLATPAGGASGDVATALAATPAFDLTGLDPTDPLPSQVRAVQAELASLGLPVALTGALDSATAEALASYQQAAGLATTGLLSAATGEGLLAPVKLLAP